MNDNHICNSDGSFTDLCNDRGASCKTRPVTIFKACTTFMNIVCVRRVSLQV